jgi:hypothetical protein
MLLRDSQVSVLYVAVYRVWGCTQGSGEWARNEGLSGAEENELFCVPEEGDTKRCATRRQQHRQR